jgi:cysteine synthase
MIDLTINEKQLANAVKQAKDNNIILPTFAQMKDPSKIPTKFVQELESIGLWDIVPRNLFRITWKNQPVEKGGKFGNVNYIELPSSLTGVNARILCLVGKWFPTGAHKVGAAFGCLAPRLITGQFDPSYHKAVWPSTGNFCRGGAFDGKLLAVDSVAILPEGMSKERFQWLKTVASEIIATPGSESNVKEIYDKCHELEATRGDKVMIFNQFAEHGNHLWHYEVTGNAIHEVLQKEMHGTDRFVGSTFTTGSAGTIGAGDYLKKMYPDSKVAAGEALQCPTLLSNGYGAHRIEGIGDKHIPWIHNVKNTDLAIAIDDQDVINVVRLFNEPAGRGYLLKDIGVSEKLVQNLGLLGFSSIANVLMCIKMTKYYDLQSDDVLVTVWTDSMDLYQSRLTELRSEHGDYNKIQAAVDYYRSLIGLKTDSMEELSYQAKKRIHHLKYFTWVEQQGMDIRELDRQWYDKNYWTNIHQLTPKIDELITSFNQKTGLL